MYGLLLYIMCCQKRSIFGRQSPDVGFLSNIIIEWVCIKKSGFIKVFLYDLDLAKANARVPC